MFSTLLILSYTPFLYFKSKNHAPRLRFVSTPLYLRKLLKEGGTLEIPVCWNGIKHSHIRERMQDPKNFTGQHAVRFVRICKGIGRSQSFPAIL